MTIETIGCVVAGLLMLMAPDATIIGILLIPCGPVMAWLSSFLLYGFGELIESAQDRNGKIDIIKYLKKEQIMLQHDQMAQIKRIAK